MSGGSFNYLCNAMNCDPGMLFSGGKDEDIERIIERLKDLPDGAKAAERLFACYAGLKVCRTIVNDFFDDLYDVLHGVEWEMSGDIRLDRLTQILKVYNEKH